MCQNFRHFRHTSVFWSQTIGWNKTYGKKIVAFAIRDIRSIAFSVWHKNFQFETKKYVFTIHNRLGNRLIRVPSIHRFYRTNLALASRALRSILTKVVAWPNSFVSWSNLRSLLSRVIANNEDSRARFSSCERAQIIYTTHGDNEGDLWPIHRPTSSGEEEKQKQTKKPALVLYVLGKKLPCRYRFYRRAWELFERALEFHRPRVSLAFSYSPQKLTFFLPIERGKHRNIINL